MKILAIDIGGTAIKYGITDENFNVCEFYEIPSEAKLGRDHLMLKVLSIVGTYYGGVDCVGISTAGQVNSEEGRIIFANESIPHYTGTEIKKMLTEKYDIPVVVENDVNSAATAEAMFGSGKGSNDFLCLTYGTGVGGAVVVICQRANSGTSLHIRAACAVIAEITGAMRCMLPHRRLSEWSGRAPEKSLRGVKFSSRKIFIILQ